MTTVVIIDPAALLAHYRRLLAQDDPFAEPPGPPVPPALLDAIRVQKSLTGYDALAEVLFHKATPEFDPEKLAEHLREFELPGVKLIWEADRP